MDIAVRLAPPPVPAGFGVEVQLREPPAATTAGTFSVRSNLGRGIVIKLDPKGPTVVKTKAAFEELKKVIAEQLVKEGKLDRSNVEHLRVDIKPGTAEAFYWLATDVNGEANKKVFDISSPIFKEKLAALRDAMAFQDQRWPNWEPGFFGHAEASTRGQLSADKKGQFPTGLAAHVRVLDKVLPPPQDGWHTKGEQVLAHQAAAILLRDRMLAALDALTGPFTPNDVELINKRKAQLRAMDETAILLALIHSDTRDDAARVAAVDKDLAAGYNLGIGDSMLARLFGRNSELVNQRRSYAARIAGMGCQDRSAYVRFAEEQGADPTVGPGIERVFFRAAQDLTADFGPLLEGLSPAIRNQIAPAMVVAQAKAADLKRAMLLEARIVGTSGRTPNEALRQSAALGIRSERQRAEQRAAAAAARAAAGAAAAPAAPAPAAGVAPGAAAAPGVPAPAGTPAAGAGRPRANARAAAFPPRLAGVV